MENFVWIKFRDQNINPLPYVSAMDEKGPLPAWAFAGIDHCLSTWTWARKGERHIFLHIMYWEMSWLSYVRFANEVFLLLASFTVTGKRLGKRENSLITILSAFEIQPRLDTAVSLYVSNFLFFFLSLYYTFNYSPIKINQFEGHFMKLQADSNYLLSKEYEVHLGLRDALAVIVLSRVSLPASPVESQADQAQQLEWHVASEAERSFMPESIPCS